MMIKILKKLRMYIEGRRIWKAKMTEKLRIRITSVPKEPRYRRPNMNNLRGKKGRAVLEEIRNMPAPSYDDIRREAEACMEQIKKKRQEEEKGEENK